MPHRIAAALLLSALFAFAEDAAKLAAEADRLAREGKFREGADDLDAAAQGLPSNEAAGVLKRAAHWRHLALYSGALSPETLLDLDPAELAETEAAVEECLASDDADRRTSIAQKLADRQELVAAVILRGGKFAEEKAGDRSEQYKLPEGETRDVVIGVPDGYKPDRLWPVFMNLHGTNASLAFCESYGPYLREWAKGRCLVVQPVSARKSGWGPMKIGEQQAPAALQYVRSKFPIDPDRIWLAGQSMGSHGTWHQAMRHGDLYAAYLPKSGTPYNAYGANWTDYLDNLRFAPAYSIHGAHDEMFPVKVPREFAKLAEQKKLNVEYHEFPDNGHEGAPEAEILKSFDWATDKVRAPYPKKFSWTTDYLDFGRYSWVEITRLDHTVKTDNVRFVDQEKKPVETRSIMQESAVFSVDVQGQAISFKTTRVEKLRVWWNPAVVDLSKEVVIKVNGSTKWKGVPAVSVRAMLEEAKRTGRRDVVFYGSVEVGN